MKSINTFLAIGLLAGSAPAQAELVVVVNPKVKVSSLSQSQLSRIFLGQSQEFPDGSVALPVNTEGRRRIFFYEAVLNKPSAQMDKYWARAVFIGNVAPPREVKANKVKAIVAETVGAISYMDSQEVDASVRVLKVTR